MKGARFSLHHLLIVIIFIIIAMVSTSIYTYHSTATTATSSGTIDPSILAIELNKKLAQLREIINATSTDTASSPITSSSEPKISENYIVPPIATGDASKLSDNSVVSPSSASSSLSVWKSNVLAKVKCMKSGQGMIFFHHARKAAGTTVRNILTAIAKKHRLKLLESEGVTLNTSPIFSAPFLFTVTLLRHPVQRIISLYWYEHVAWHVDVKKDMKSCSTMLEWVEAWRDHSNWKNAFLKENPTSVYVEVENYFIKSLIGWNASQPAISETDVTKAFHVLQQFDMILLSEMMNDNKQMDVIRQLFDAKIPATIKANAANTNTRMKLKNTLAKEEDEVLRILYDINKYDIMLYELALPMIQERFQFISSSRTLTANKQRLNRYSTSIRTKKEAKPSKQEAIPNNCPSSKNLSPAITKQVGIFRPPKHKGPVNANL